MPTPTAWELGRKSAETLLTRHFQDTGTHLRSLALSVWGTSNMRTGGDDIAQALAFIGARPVWDPSSLRVSGYEITPLAKLGRPRVDVTLRISGLFRDAFPQQIALFDRAIRAIGALDEPEDQNPIATQMRSDALGLMRDGASEADAAMQAGHRIFGSKPGAYGAGLQALIDSGRWSDARRTSAAPSSTGGSMPTARMRRVCRSWRALRRGSARSRRWFTTRTIASTICSTATTTTSSRVGWWRPQNI